MRIEKIVVGIDFSPYSEAARLRAFELALATGAEVILYHTCEDADYRGQRSWLVKSEKHEELVERGRQLARVQLDRLADGSPAGVRVSAELGDAVPDRALVEAVQRHKADLLVIGTHGRTGLQRLRLARIAERIVRNCPCSVLVARARKTETPGFGRILVPTDFSGSADHALAAACSLVADDGRVDLLHCWLTYFYSTGYHGLYEESVSVEPEMAEAIRQQGADLVERNRDPRFALRFEERYTSPVRGICDALEDAVYDMVVMGSHGRHGFKRVLLGSTAEAIVRLANCSVFVAREAPSSSKPSSS